MDFPEIVVGNFTEEALAPAQQGGARTHPIGAMVPGMGSPVSDTSDEPEGMHNNTFFLDFVQEDLCPDEGSHSCDMPEAEGAASASGVSRGHIYQVGGSNSGL